MTGDANASNQPLLFSRFPGLRGKIPWTSLAVLPTPVQRLEAMGREAGADIWVKRDDLTSPEYGGNKVRKLEFLLGQAMAKGQKTVVTMGGLGTNHGLATAVFGQRLGLKVVLKLMDQPVNEYVLKNLRLFAAHGARMDHCCATSRLAWEFYFLERLRNPGACFIPAGGSNPLGVLGYVNAGLEIAESVQRREIPEPQAIFVAAGTCGTLAGLALGLSLAGSPIPVTGVQVTPDFLANVNKTLGLALRAHGLLRRCGASLPPFTLNDNSIIMDASQFGEGYGHPTEKGLHAISMARALEGLELEPTYTGKAFAAVLERAAGGSGPLLFVNTYNSADLSEKADAVDPASLPPVFARLFAETDREQES